MSLNFQEWFPMSTSVPPLQGGASESIHTPSLKLLHPLPYGAQLMEDGVQFSVFSRHAESISLLLYDRVDDMEPSSVIQFDKNNNRWGDIWSMFIPGLRAGQLYHLQADGPFCPDQGLRFDPNCRLIDPFCKALAGTFQSNSDGVSRPPKCVVVDDSFDWKGDRHLRRDLCDTIIYEMHVKGFTQSPTSSCKYPGTYKGVIEMVPYLKQLGITAVELMPIHEFPILGSDGLEPRIKNYWGYDTMAFFSPHRGYAWDKTPGGQVKEFKQMVLALHQAGIEVILDVVFNHTAEGNEKGPTLSFKGLENPVYYMLEPEQQYYRNFSGCGNTFNGNHPICRELIFNCLRYWVHSYHVDGFRFDLASILSRDRNGAMQSNAPLLEQISEDPLLADTKIIAEAWDAAGAYQVGHFGPANSTSRWAEWNGRYRDDVRRFWRGDPGMTGAFATRLSGSSDLYQTSGRNPYHSINFITSHDGFTLNDLVSYNWKHNDANGECNCDGENNNNSYNYGQEGPTDNEQIEAVRNRQIKNFFATLLLSQGAPMFVAGDEGRRTQQGNNNAYCQDNDISWLDWKRTHNNLETFNFVRALIEFRKREPTLRRRHFLTGQPTTPNGFPDVAWYKRNGAAFDWNDPSNSLTCMLSAEPRVKVDDPPNMHILIFFHAGAEPTQFAFPPATRSLPWRLFIDTAAPAGQDAFPNLNGPPAKVDEQFTMEGRSLRCYVVSGE